MGSPSRCQSVASQQWICTACSNRPTARPGSPGDQVRAVGVVWMAGSCVSSGHGAWAGIWAKGVWVVGATRRLASVGLEEREVLEREELELERGPADQLSFVRCDARLGHRPRHDRLRQQLRVAGGRLRRVCGVLEQRLLVQLQVGGLLCLDARAALVHCRPVALDIHDGDPHSAEPARAPSGEGV